MSYSRSVPGLKGKSVYLNDIFQRIDIGIIKMVAAPGVIFRALNHLCSHGIIMDILNAFQDITVPFYKVTFESALPDITGVIVFVPEFLAVGQGYGLHYLGDVGYLITLHNQMRMVIHKHKTVKPKPETLLEFS